MDFSGIAGILGGVTVVVGIFVAAYLALDRTQKANLRDTVSDRGVRIDDLEKALERTEHRATTAEADRDAMSRMVTGEAHLVAIQQELEEHQTEARAYWSRTSDLLVSIEKSLASLAGRRSIRDPNRSASREGREGDR